MINSLNSDCLLMRGRHERRYQEVRCNSHISIFQTSYDKRIGPKCQRHDLMPMLGMLCDALGWFTQTCPSRVSSNVTKTSCNFGVFQNILSIRFRLLERKKKFVLSPTFLGKWSISRLRRSIVALLVTYLRSLKGFYPQFQVCRCLFASKHTFCSL